MSLGGWRVFSRGMSFSLSWLPLPVFGSTAAVFGKILLSVCWEQFLRPRTQTSSNTCMVGPGIPGAGHSAALYRAYGSTFIQISGSKEMDKQHCNWYPSMFYMLYCLFSLFIYLFIVFVLGDTSSSYWNLLPMVVLRGPCSTGDKIWVPNCKVYSLFSYLQAPCIGKGREW